ncbi:hypothetical protein QJS10_CPB12g01022 [Acorus calamus]|uniref:Uncharacterized protein n=1 Tax=Acorus calamus TaxID=4465 RepID=A0AAV9DNK1_ACOCL|nr:hypothetical protein QJS10_CPB12g01022 [Acorus calamus]
MRSRLRTVRSRGNDTVRVVRSCGVDHEPSITGPSHQTMSALKSANKELKGMMKTVIIQDIDVSY